MFSYKVNFDAIDQGFIACALSMIYYYVNAPRPLANDVEAPTIPIITSFLFSLKFLPPGVHKSISYLPGFKNGQSKMSDSLNISSMFM